MTGKGRETPGGIKLEEPGNPEEAAGANIEQEQVVQQEEEAQPPNPAGEAMANNNVQGGQLSTIPMFTGTRGLDALTYAKAIDGTIPQFGWTQQQAAQAAATRGGPAVAN